MDCPSPRKDKTTGLSESAPTSVFWFHNPQESNELSKDTFGAHRNPQPPKIPSFSQQKSASYGTIPTVGGIIPTVGGNYPTIDGNPMRPPPKALPPPPTLAKRPRKKRGITATLRRSAHLSLVELRRAFKPQAIMYIIYNITQSKALQYNKTRGMTWEEINWAHLRILLPSWKAKDEIWAVGTDGVEYACVKREIAKNPIFGLQKSFMPDWVRTQFDTSNYETYYYEELLKTPVTTTSVEGWLVTKHPITGAIIDIV